MPNTIITTSLRCLYSSLKMACVVETCISNKILFTIDRNFVHMLCRWYISLPYCRRVKPWHRTGLACYCAEVNIKICRNCNASHIRRMTMVNAATALTQLSRETSLWTEPFRFSHRRWADRSQTLYLKRVNIAASFYKTFYYIFYVSSQLQYAWLFLGGGVSLSASKGCFFFFFCQMYGWNDSVCLRVLLQKRTLRKLDFAIHPQN